MVALQEIVASNERIATALPENLVAVFVGGTSGVGEYTLKAFAKYARSPRVYVIGRSNKSADRIIKECLDVSPDGHFEFIQSDISLVKNVDKVCEQIKAKESAINILFETQGTMAFDAKTSEGLSLPLALTLHSRLRFILNLLPLIQNATSLRRVVSVMAATVEGDIDLSNISGDGFPLMKWRDQYSAMQTLMLQRVASQAPNVSFVHAMPGVVESGIQRDLKKTWGMKLTLALSSVLMSFMDVKVPPGESGLRNLFLATSARHPPRKAVTIPGVPLTESIKVAKGCNGETGSGVYSINHKGEEGAPKTWDILRRHQEDGTAQRIWDTVMSDFKRITGNEGI